MSGGFNNPIVGGDGGLVYPSIHSPNFSAGPPITGWSIDKNGNAYFSGTVGGLSYEITSAGAFFYTGTPANGNLFLSIAATAGIDQYSNPYGSGLNVGNQGGAHLAISTAGDLLIASSANAPVLFGYHGDGSIRFYNPAGITAGQLAAAVSPLTGSDSAANAYAAGFTGPVAAFQPASSPQAVEAWHYVGAATGLSTTFGSGWSNVGSSNVQVAFKRIAEKNAVWIKGYAANVTAANTAGIFTLPANYIPASQQIFACIENGDSAANDLVVQTNGVVKMFASAGAGSYSLDAMVSLDV
jgi:hypothetical protein